MCMIKASNPSLQFEYGRGLRLSFEVDRDSKGIAQQLVDDLRDGYLSVEVKRYREKRSLDANAYAWVLLGKMADKLTQMGTPISKDELYEQELRKYGQGAVIKLSPTSPVKPDDLLRGFRIWEAHEKMYSELNRYYRVWVGSSHYNTEEMSVFIDGIIEDAKELGIETLPPAELERMLAQWQRA